MKNKIVQAVMIVVTAITSIVCVSIAMIYLVKGIAIDIIKALVYIFMIQ